MDALTEHGLIAEVANGTFSFKNKISAAHVKMMWDKLARFVVDALKQQKGVLVPNLGTFAVGPVVGETRKKVRPAFTLLETRYAGVSQERPKYSIGGRCPVVQPNYGLLATAAAVHRGACQRLILELMQRLGVHILSGRPISVMFPGLGRLFTSKAGRIQFEFETLLREYFELERERVIPEMAVDGADGLEAEEPRVAHVVKGLQQVHLHNPPTIRNRPTTGLSAEKQGSPSARVQRSAHAPYKGGLLDLWRLCRSNDRISSGCVPRLQLEQWLHKECAQVLRQVAAATILELLSINTYGKTGKHILYKPFLDQLEAAVGDVSPVEIGPQAVQSPRRIVEVRVNSPGTAARAEQDVAEVTFSSTAAGQQPSEQRQQPLHLQTTPRDPYMPSHGQPTPQGPWMSSHGQYAPQAQAQSVPRGQYGPPGYNQPEGQRAPTQGQYGQAPQGPYGAPQGQPTPQGPREPSSQGQYPYPRLSTPQGQYVLQAPYAAQGQYTPQGQPYAPAQTPYPQQQAYSAPVAMAGQYGSQSQGPDARSAQNQHRAARPPRPLVLPQTPASVGGSDWPGRGQGGEALGSDGAVPLHYYQDKLSPSSRREFDNFNRLHFKELEQARGQGYKQRAVTPKVGEDVLNQWEYLAVRQGGEAVSPAQLLRLENGTPYSRDEPQIMTLAHESPSPPRPVPGLPNHYYQHQSQPQGAQQYRVPTPILQRPQSARQPTPGPREESPQISQYDIINEADPVQRQRLRNELANALQRDWSEQIREKEQVLEEINEAQHAWPYAPTRQPNDKRPSSAVSRPPSVLLREP